MLASNIRVLSFSGKTRGILLILVTYEVGKEVVAEYYYITKLLVFYG